MIQNKKFFLTGIILLSSIVFFETSNYNSVFALGGVQGVRVQKIVFVLQKSAVNQTVLIKEYVVEQALLKFVARGNAGLHPAAPSVARVSVLVQGSFVQHQHQHQHHRQLLPLNHLLLLHQQQLLLYVVHLMEQKDAVLDFVLILTLVQQTPVGLQVLFVNGQVCV